MQDISIVQNVETPSITATVPPAIEKEDTSNQQDDVIVDTRKSTTIEHCHVEHVAEEQTAIIETQQYDDTPLHYTIEDVVIQDNTTKEIQHTQNEREFIVVSTQTDNFENNNKITDDNQAHQVPIETEINQVVEKDVSEVIDPNVNNEEMDVTEKIFDLNNKDFVEIPPIIENCIIEEADVNKEVFDEPLTFEISYNTVIVTPDCNNTENTTTTSQEVFEIADLEPKNQVEIIPLETQPSQTEELAKELALLVSIPKTSTCPKEGTSSFSISRLIADNDKTKDCSSLVPFDISDPNLNAIMNEETVETSQVVIQEDVNESFVLNDKPVKIGVPHILDNIVLTNLERIPICDEMNKHITSEDEKTSCTNGVKLKSALKTNNGLTGRITYTSNETIKVPMTQHLNFGEELLKGENFLSGPVNGYQLADDSHSNNKHFGIVQNELKRKTTETENKPKQKRVKYSEEHKKYYVYPSGGIQSSEHSRINIHKPSFLAYNVSTDDSKLRGKRQRLEVMLTEMSLDEMKAQLEKKKRQRLERTANRLKEQINNTRIVETTPPKEKSLIRERFNYIDTTPSEPPPRLVLPEIPRTSHDTSMMNSQFLLCDNCLPPVYPDNNPIPLNLSIDVDPQISEFSNSPKFLPDTERIVEQCLAETNDAADVLNSQPNFLSDNSNFYSDNQNLPLPAVVPELIDETLQQLLDTNRDVYVNGSSMETTGKETRLPFKKRRMSVTVSVKEAPKEEISYPATPMISIAEVQACGKLPQNKNNSNATNNNNNNSNRPFKTPAERKEMPPIPPVYCNDPFTYNVNTFQMNNLQLPYVNVSCNPYYPISPLVIPFESVQGYDKKMNFYICQEKPTNRKQNGSKR